MFSICADRRAVPVTVPLLAPPLETKVDKFARQMLVELAVSLAIGVVSALFVTSTAGLFALFIGIQIQLIVSGILRWRSLSNPSARTQWLAPTAFSLSAANHAYVLTHEAGHAAAYQALFAEAKTQITLYPYEGGLTSFRGKGITKLGEWIGKERLFPLVAAAGPALSCIASGILLALGLKLERKHPETARMLIVSALVNFLFHVVYALSALFASPTYLAHDFVALWVTAAIHPVIAAIAILAIPFFIYAIARSSSL
ncbi:MAG: hypothetical protein KGJ02_03695 [Verrucomicrobiota bacterium]|nr:hypothetical protein [Verrucomicrobiota bacterium]